MLDNIYNIAWMLAMVAGVFLFVVIARAAQLHMRA